VVPAAALPAAGVAAVAALLLFAVTAPWLKLDMRSANRSPLPPAAALPDALLPAEAAASARVARCALSAET
jgi:hypothetical protein